MAQNGDMELNAVVKAEPVEQGSGDHEVVDASQADAPENGTHSEDYQKLVEYGIDPKVAGELEVIYKSGTTL